MSDRDRLSHENSLIFYLFGPGPIWLMGKCNISLYISVENTLFMLILYR